jgi:RNA polymerase sigma factor (sigma-70 family)
MVAMTCQPPPGATNARPLGEGDPPPEDILTREQVIAELEELYRSGARQLAERLGRLGAGPDERMDFIHEAFARMLGRSTASQLATEYPAAYVSRISRNLLTDRGRAQTVRRQWAEQADTRAQHHHDQVVYLETRDRLRRIEAAVMKLKPKTREVFLARRLDGLSYVEISELTGMSVRAVERHMGKAIAKLSHLMDRV